MSFYKAGLMAEWVDGFSDGCLDGWIQTYIAPGSHLICNAYVLLPFTVWAECYPQILLLKQITFIRCGY